MGLTPADWATSARVTRPVARVRRGEAFDIVLRLGMATWYPPYRQGIPLPRIAQSLSATTAGIGRSGPASDRAGQRYPATGRCWAITRFDPGHKSAAHAADIRILPCDFP